MKMARRIAVLIDTSSAYGRGLLQGVSRFRSEACHWSLDFTPRGLSEIPEWFDTWRGDGILARVESRAAIDKVLELRIPCIDLRGTLGDAGFALFGIDNRSVAETAFQHFREQNLTSFAFYGGPGATSRYDVLRGEMFEQVVDDAGFPCHVFRDAAAPDRRPSRQARFESIGAWLVGLPKPTGVLACHDQCALELLTACRRLEIAVPDTLAIMGVDNDPYICDLCIPPLTSIELNTEQIGYQAAAALDAMIEDAAGAPKARYFPVRGVIARQSTDTIVLDDPHVASVVRKVRSQACNGINVQDILKSVPLSQSTLQRRFKAVMGHTIKTEITMVRIAHAKRLLLETDLPIKTISRRVGFQQPKYFVQTFHRRVGTTPAAYRKKHTVTQ